jgi:hypothetical protein
MLNVFPSHQTCTQLVDLHCFRALHITSACWNYGDIIVYPSTRTAVVIEERPETQKAICSTLRMLEWSCLYF